MHSSLHGLCFVMCVSGSSRDQNFPLLSYSREELKDKIKKKFDVNGYRTLVRCVRGIDAIQIPGNVSHDSVFLIA